MTVNITAVHMEGGTVHEHIAKVKWTNPSDNSIGESTRATMVDWIDGGGRAYVAGGARTVIVETRHPQGQPAYIQTKADNVWTNNLLSLPRY